MSKKLNWLLVGAATTLIAGAAVAQDAKKNDAPGERRIERRVIVHGAPGGEMRVMRMHGGGSPEKRAEHLKTMLQLRPNQEAALKTYIEAINPGEHRMAKIEHKTGETTTTPQRLEQAEKRMAEHQAAMKKRNDATRTFYAQLDASQKKVFDTMPRGHGGQHRMAMMHHGAPMAFRHHMPVPPTPPVPPAPPQPRD
jgi:hypothetical protein